MKQNSYPKFRLLITSLLVFCLGATAQVNYFEKAPQLKGKYALEKNLKSSVIYKIRETAMKQYLGKAPLEYKANGAAPLALVVPLPNNTSETFEMYESPMLSPEIAAQHPEIKTFAGKGKNNVSASIRITFTSAGFSAIILGINGDAVYFEKANNLSTDNIYISYFGSKATHPGKVQNSNNKCGTPDKTVKKNANEADASFINRTNSTTTTGGTMRTFRLAMAATAEFTTAKGGGNVNNAFAALVAYVNRMIAVYKVELSVSFTLVSGTNLVYTTNGVPYTNSNQTLMLTQNQTNIDNVIGSANYDVGHILGTAGGSGGGIAASSSVCDASSKAQGVSGVGDGSFAAIFDDQLIDHEVGHQFSMSHSFNSSIPVCTTREPSTSVEVGSGTTIMSYGYTCSDNTGNDDYEATYLPILDFHAANYSQAVAFIATVTCFTSSATGNTPPAIVSTTTDKTIPKSTPFALTGVATDANVGNVLKYSWEGTNIGTITPVPSTFLSTTQPPFFRSYAPVNTATRYFPRLSAILDGTNSARGDKLPSIGIATTHRLTVRDNVDGVTTANITVTVDGNSGPFLETTNLAGSYASSSQQTITWSVNNTTAAPVSCANVDILLSVDGGQTFPYTLLAATPNDGSQAVTLPALTTSTSAARIKVQASNNIFFDISNTNFSIAAAIVPVTITNLKAFQKNTGIQVEWNTQNELNLNSYEVEKSNDASNFKKAGTVAANGLSSYNWFDGNPVNGNNYYRLKMMDKDGSFKYSSIVNVKIGGIKNVFTVAGNPIKNNTLVLQLENVDKGSYTLNIYNNLGQQMMSKTIIHEGGSATQTLYLGTVSAGTYQLNIFGNNIKVNKTIVVE